MKRRNRAESRLLKYMRSYEDVVRKAGLVAKQEFKEEADVNNIVRKYLKTGVPPWVATGQPMYEDFTTFTTLEDAFEKVRLANERFSQLPAQARLELGNDPARLLEADRDFFARHGFLKASGTVLEDDTPTPQPASTTEPVKKQRVKAPVKAPEESADE